MSEQEQIKEYVRRRYGERARTSARLSVIAPSEGACCTTDQQSSASFPALYQQAEVEGLPTEALAASAGCGNPTALAGLRPGERVLDLGSGGGIDCFLAARQVGPTGHVTGLDMTPEMLALARRNASVLGLPNVEFIHAEMERMPLPDASVDVVISNCVLCLSPDKDAVLSEAFRVLAPGGRVHISDMLALGPVPQEVRDDPEKWAGCIAGADEGSVYAARLGRAGFVDVSLEPQGSPRAIAGADGDSPWGVVSIRVQARKPGA